MERRQLEYVVAVAEAGSISRAAERLHVAQPGVSAQLALLERELGDRVFDRDRRGVRPTAVGATVVDRARRALAAFDDVRAAVAEAHGELRGAVTVGTARGVPLGELAPALGAVHREHPGITLTLVEGESTPLLAGVVEGEVHLALVGLPGVPPTGVRTRTVLRDRLVLAVAPGHRWHGRRRVTLTDLDRAAVVALPVGTGNRDAFDAAARRAGVDPDVRFEAGTLAAVLDLARAGLGAAVVPTAALATAMGDGLHAVTLTPEVTSRLALAWADPRTRTPSPAVRALVRAALAPAN